MIDWVDAVKDYKKQYDNDIFIHEYVDSLVPIYYHDILRAFSSGNLWANTDIEQAHVGMPVWRFMQEVIYEEYMNEFMNEWEPFDEEE